VLHAVFGFEQVSLGVAKCSAKVLDVGWFFYWGF
jgi:hypothetical protein